MSKSIYQDYSISLSAKGMLNMVMSFPDTWDFNIKGMVKMLPHSRDFIYKIINELISKGYCVKTKVKDEHGRYCGIEYCFTDIAYSIPDSVEPTTDLPCTLKPDTVKNTQYNTNTNRVNKEIKTDLQANPSDSPKQSFNLSPQSAEHTPNIVQSEYRINKKYEKFDIYNNVFLTKEGTLNYLRSRLSIYHDYSIIDVGRTILESLRHYQTNNLHDSRKNTEAFVDSWLRKNIDNGNAFIQNSPDSYNEIDPTMLRTFVDNTAEKLYQVFTPKVPEEPKRKLRNLLADDLDD